VARLDGCPADKILVTDSIPRRGDSPRQLEVVSVAPLLARAIRNIHRCESVSSLFEEVS
jgi:phosphoribosylpyrophosphate synthetase